MKTDQDLIFEAYTKRPINETSSEDNAALASAAKAAIPHVAGAIAGSMMDGEDGETFEFAEKSSAVELLEQLKEEEPELEDKINQILEKIFDAVDVLKQESYVDDPQLMKAFDSLIQGDF